MFSKTNPPLTKKVPLISLSESIKTLSGVNSQGQNHELLFFDEVAISQDLKEPIVQQLVVYLL